MVYKDLSGLIIFTKKKWLNHYNVCEKLKIYKSHHKLLSYIHTLILDVIDDVQVMQEHKIHGGFLTIISFPNPVLKTIMHGHQTVPYF